MGDVYTNPPQSRNEAILRATIDGTEYTAPPQSRIEDLLLELKEAIEQGGGAGGMSKDTYDPDDAVATAGGIAAYVDDEITDLHLGTASTKNSTSTVTDSTDLVESGAVKDIIGWGNKNLAKTYEWVGDTSGVTYRYSKDGLTLNGTATATTSRPSSTQVPDSGKFILPAGTYTASADSDDANIEVIAFDPVENLTANGNTFTINTNRTVYVRCMIISGKTYDNIKISLQVEKGDTATAYEPYHASVDETKANNTVITNNIETGTTASKAYSVNDMFILNGKFGKCTQSIASGGTFTLDTNYIETTIGEIISSLL